MSLKHWKIIKSTMVFDHKWYKLRQDVVELPTGKIVDDYFISIRPDVVVIFALTPNQEVMLVKQYKHGTADVVVELPGGVIDEGESAEVAAQRELVEETGYQGETPIFIASLIDNPTKDTNKINVFIIMNAIEVAHQELDDNEDIEVLKFPVGELKDKILSGEIKVSGSVAGIFLALAYLEDSQILKDK